MKQRKNEKNKTNLLFQRSIGKKVPKFNQKMLSKQYKDISRAPNNFLSNDGHQLKPQTVFGYRDRLRRIIPPDELSLRTRFDRESRPYRLVSDLKPR